MAIRKEIDNADSDIRKIDEIITYRRKRYLGRQIELYENMKNEDEKDEAKALLRGNNIFKIFRWKISNHQPTLATITVISLLISCVLLTNQFA